ncbi:MAG: TAXI family TRAP transporter solute-binding subunit [Geminicoccales bacterium]
MAFGNRIMNGATLVLGLTLLGVSISTPAVGDSYTIATGRSTGKSYAVGVGISSLTKLKLLPSHEVDISAVETKGFVQNVRMLQQGEAEFAVLQAMFGHFARTGTGTFAGELPRDDIRAIAMLWRDADHFVMRRDYLTTGTVDDLFSVHGMPVSMGLDGPGPIESNRLLLSHFGVDVDNAFDLVHLNYQDSTQALQRGRITTMSTPIRPPARHIVDALASGQHQLLEFTDEQIAKADGGLGLWSRYIIPAATYPGQDRDIQTVAKSNLLVARADVDEDVVYHLTKTMFENLDFLRNIHEAMYETAADRALIGMPLPLHPGALRYYKEIGLLNPGADLTITLAERLRADAHFSSNGALNTVQAKTIVRPAVVTDSPEVLEPKTFVVYFDLNSRDVTGEGRLKIDEARAFADGLVAAKIEVSGHTDRSGNPAQNATLAEARAVAVEAELRSATVGDHEITIRGLGASVPAVDLAQRIEPRNRRVEIKIWQSSQTVEDAKTAITVPASNHPYDQETQRHRPVF